MRSVAREFDLVSEFAMYALVGGCIFAVVLVIAGLVILIRLLVRRSRHSRSDVP